MNHPIINTAILGASGYTGVELLRLLRHHPHVKISALTGESKAGLPMSQVYHHLRDVILPDLITIAQVDFSALDLIFCCLPHGTTQEVIAQIPKGVKVIDLSADFRLKDAILYEEIYGKPHQAISLQSEAVYGLSEIYRDEIAKARLVANPGCYPTAAQLPLIPLIRAGLIKPDNIIIDAKSGVTGAGRKAAQHLLFTEINEAIAAYGVGTHRHAPEIDQGLSDETAHKVQVRFTPHLVPMNRGILATIYVDLQAGQTADSLREYLRKSYKHEAYLSVLEVGQLPSTAHVRGTNHCHIAVCDDRVEGKAVVVSAIDNLVKGASGQAIQNMNIMFGLAENQGLQSLAVFP